MIIKSTKKSKRLAMLVGAALSFGVAYGMMPGDALAANYTVWGVKDQPTNPDDKVIKAWIVKDESGIKTAYNSIDEVLNQINIGAPDAGGQPNHVTVMGSLDAFSGDGTSSTPAAAGSAYETYRQLKEHFVGQNVTMLGNSSVTIQIKHATMTLTAPANGAIITAIPNPDNSDEPLIVANGGSYTFTQASTATTGNTIDLAPGSKLDNMTIENISADTTLPPIALNGDGVTVENMTVDTNAVVAVPDTTTATIGTLDLSNAGSKLVVGNKGDALANQNISTIKVDDPATQLVGADGSTGVTSVNFGDNTTLNVTGASGLTGLTSVTAGTVKLDDAGASTDLSSVAVSADTFDTAGSVTLSGATGLENIKNVEAGSFTTGSNNAALENLTIKDGGTLDTTGGSVTAGSVTLPKDVTVTDGTITTDKVIISGDVTSGDVAGLQTALNSMTITSTDGTSTPSFIMNGFDDLTETEQNNLKNALATATGADPSEINVADPKAATSDLSGAMDNESAAKAALSTIPWATTSATEVANYDPFATKLPTADELASLASSTTANGAFQDRYNAIKAARDAAKKLEYMGVDPATVTDSAGNPGQSSVYYDNLLNGLTTSAADQAAKIREAVRNGSGRTAAAPGATSARTAAAITTVLTDNVVNRNAEIRDFEAAAAVDDGRPAPDRVWFQYKHTNMDVDGDIYNESNVNTNTFQLGYDAKVGNNDYLGVFVGTTTGDAEFNGPTRSGSMDIDGSFDIGVYGTHLLQRISILTI